jgi:hypothetical protein
MSEWLQQERPQVWRRCCSLLRQIDAAWYAPLSEFERTIANFVAAFATACEVYRAHLQKHPQGILEDFQVSDTARCG